MVEDHLQSLIEALYRLDGSPPVSNFRIDRDTLERLSGVDDACREKLLVQEDEEETLVALFIAQDVLQRASKFATQQVDLDAFCVATEGVSHFVYLTFCGAGLGRPVRQIELELQAEIDKFVLLRFVLGHSAEDLVTALFDRFTLTAGLDAEDTLRYRTANRAARRYARWLDRRLALGSGDTALADARALYRKPFSAKLEHISAAAA